MKTRLRSRTRFPGSLVRSRGQHGEEGMVLVGVIMVAVIISGMLGVMMVSGIQTQKVGRARQDFSGALAAAQAGIDDYLTRLNYSPNSYYAVQDTTNPAFYGWTQVTGGGPKAEYRYKVDASRAANYGTITITASGRAGGEVRTIRDSLRVSSFADYLYFSDFETVDPALYPQMMGYSEADAGHATTGCRRYRWQPNSVRRFLDRSPNPDVWRDCADIAFATGDYLQGKVHSNDSFLMSGSPRFGGVVETGWTTGSYNCRTPCPATPIFDGGTPVHSIVPMPPGNDDLLTTAETRIPSGSGVWGCVYTGPTRIRFVGTTMRVTSPNTRTLPRAGCGSFPANAGDLTEKTVNLVDGSGNPTLNGAVFVRNVPSPPTPPTTRRCITAFVVAGDLTTYNCSEGDLFVEGELNGQLTLGAQHNVILTNNITYAPGTESVLGLVAYKFVQVFHPVRSCGASTTCRFGGANIPMVPMYGGDGMWTNPVINALVMSSQNSFMVQQWNRGNRTGGTGGGPGTLTVNGGIIQRFRGAVATAGGTGYVKNYVYDERLRYQIPPHFITPDTVTWGVNTYAEPKAQDSADFPAPASPYTGTPGLYTLT